jgi:sugar/nucleoside kinase (ribokinase family)
VVSIAVAGHVCLDVVPRLSTAALTAPGLLIEVGPLTFRPGGSVANTGAALADLGADVTPYASVGDDDAGRLLTSLLGDVGLRSPRLAIAPDVATSYSVVIEPPGVDRTFWHHIGANVVFDGTAVELDGVELLHVGYPPLLPGITTAGGRPLSTLLARARAADVTTSVDLAVVDPRSPAGMLDWDAILRELCREVDVLSPSLDDLTSALRIDEPYSPALVDRLADRLLADGAGVVAISAGRRGLRVRTADVARLRAGGALLRPLADAWADQALTVPPVPVKAVVTTNGAGDACTAGLLMGIASGADPIEAAHLAVATSAAVISGRRPTRAGIAAVDSIAGAVLERGAGGEE